MAYGYVKIFGSMLQSTVWVGTSKEVKLVWVALLALKGPNHVVEASIPGLAAAAGVSVDECVDALEYLNSPDPHSRTKEFGGRRIEEVDGGWLILNGAKYRDKKVERREYQAEWAKRNYHEKVKRVKKRRLQEDRDVTFTAPGLTQAQMDEDRRLREEREKAEADAVAMEVLNNEKGEA